MFPEPLPPWEHYRWAPQPMADDPVGASPPDRVVDLTGRLDADGRLRWTPPPGEWRVFRIGMTPAGIRNHPASEEGTGLEVDKMNRRWATHHFGQFVGRLLEQVPPERRRARLCLDGRTVAEGVEGARPAHPSVSGPSRPPKDFRGESGVWAVWSVGFSEAEVARLADEGRSREERLLLGLPRLARDGRSWAWWTAEGGHHRFV